MMTGAASHVVKEDQVFVPASDTNMEVDDSGWSSANWWAAHPSISSDASLTHLRYTAHNATFADEHLPQAASVVQLQLMTPLSHFVYSLNAVNSSLMALLPETSALALRLRVSWVLSGTVPVGTQAQASSSFGGSVFEQRLLSCAERSSSW